MQKIVVQKHKTHKKRKILTHKMENFRPYIFNRLLTPFCAALYKATL
jgi:hypothetical protein